MPCERQVRWRMSEPLRTDESYSRTRSKRSWRNKDGETSREARLQAGTSASCGRSDDGIWDIPGRNSPLRGCHSRAGLLGDPGVICYVCSTSTPAGRHQ
jgi:hypothetical protein